VRRGDDPGAGGGTDGTEHEARPDLPAPGA
jgi:hypothetical protein